MIGAVALLAAAALASPAAAAPQRGVVTVRTVKVADAGNASVGIVPFTDAVYQSCADAPDVDPPCQEVGGVDYRYGIGELEVTVGQWVKFLNTVDPKGTDPYDLYDPTESAEAWPRFGQVEMNADAAAGKHYRAAFPEWKDKPYGFADFPRAARFANSLDNGRVIDKSVSSSGGYDFVKYKVRLGRQSGRGMYDVRDRPSGGATRSSVRGFVIPSQDEWMKAAYYDPSGGGTYSYWKYPTNPGVFGDGYASAPAQTTLDPGTGDVTNAATQPLANYKATTPAPNWCPAALDADDCTETNPFGLPPQAYAEAYQGSVGTVGGAATRSPWGTLDQGGNAVEWTDTITPAPAGTSGPRVWRRLHGGVPNAPGYQLWLSAIGLQPENNRFYDLVYPWLGFRVGVVGNLKPGA
ncbi:MAG: hypothetical protein U0R51_02190 [Solirubrobacterales bacterium]